MCHWINRATTNRADGKTCITYKTNVAVGNDRDLFAVINVVPNMREVAVFAFGVQTTV